MTARPDFWARRKAAVQAEAEAEARARDSAKEAQARAELEAKDDADILAELDLPDPDLLQLGDDVRGFMSSAVPERLRRRALRRLWRLNPILANLDGLNDYDTDFTDAAFLTGDVPTTYQVGKGLLAHVKEMARQADAAAPGETADPAPGDPDEDASGEAEVRAETRSEALDDPAAGTPSEPQADAAMRQEIQQDQSDTRFVAAPRRRMRFVYQG
ncbi:MAG: DUF3306 domain-containing protein [Rhodobacteraceae bacterium]|nr:MAG: DUF3306 domain-containing protein [Paracoccaceae bacterium]